MKFIRQESHKKKRLGTAWRKPRGIDSKQRLRMQHRPIVSPGYGSLADEKGKHKSGKDLVYINNLKDAEKADDKVIAVINSRLGFRKKKPILQELIKNKVEILNIPDPKKYLTQQQEKLKPVKEKKKPKPVIKLKPKKEETIEDTLTDEEKKKVEKKEIDKLLTKKQ